MEQAVGVVVDLVLRGGGQADQQGVKPGKNGPVLLIDRTVRLVEFTERACLSSAEFVREWCHGHVRDMAA
ncbi:hypothetical protein PJN30_22710, partial [Mycobacterium kansasii]